MLHFLVVNNGGTDITSLKQAMDVVSNHAIKICVGLLIASAIFKAIRNNY